MFFSDKLLAFRNQIEHEGIDFIRTLQFMGPATSYHLAKNIGLDVVKPDRHLVRIAESAGGFSPNDFCEMIAQQTGDKVSVIDIVPARFWDNVPNQRLITLHVAG